MVKSKIMAQKGAPFDRCDYLLPAGCGDLMDVLRLQQAKAGAPKGQKQSRLFLRKLAQKEMPVVCLPSRVAVKDLAAALGVKLYHVIRLLKQMGVFTDTQQQLSIHVAAKVARKYGYVVEKRGI